MNLFKMTRSSALALLALLVVSQAGSHAMAAKECGPLSLPNSFSIDEKLFTVSGGLKVKDNGKTIAFLNKKFWAMTETYILRNSDKKTVGSANRIPFEIGFHYQMKDCNGQKLGSFHIENTITNVLSNDNYAVYSIKDAAGNTVLESERFTVLATEIKVTKAGDPSQVVAILKRSFVGAIANDQWTVDVLQPTQIDARVVLFIAAFKTLADNENVRLFKK